MAELKMLALDLGASSGRGIVGSYDGQRLTLRENHRFSNDPMNVNGTLYWDTLRLFWEIENALRACALGVDADVVSVGIDTWGVDFGLLDRGGMLVSNPVHYRDARTEGVPKRAYEVMSRSAVYDITGLQTNNFNTLFQLLALKEKHPDILEAAQTLLFTPDLLNYFLTGEIGCEYTIASTSQLLDARKRDFSDTLLQTFGIPRHLFAPISMPGGVVGPLQKHVLDEVGALRANVIRVGSHDTASAVLAVPAKEDDFIFLSSGTWSLMGTELDMPALGDAAKEFDFTNEGGVGGKIRCLRNIMGLWLEQESRRQWKREGINVSFDVLSAEAMACPPLRFIINPDDPVFSAPGDLPGRIRTYCKQTGQPVPETQGEIVRCIFDSLSLRYRWTAECIDQIKGKHTPVIYIVGGGTKEEPLCQLCADACNRVVYAGPVEATAIGNLSLQAIAHGELKDVAQAREMVRRSFDVKEYTPRGNKQMWDEAYGRFLMLPGC